MKVKGKYVSVWEDGELASDATIDTESKNVVIHDTYYPSDEGMKCQILIDQYVECNGVKYPCYQSEDYKGKGFYYE